MLASIVCAAGPSVPGLAIRMEMFTFDGAVCVAVACAAADCAVSALCTAVWTAPAPADTTWVTGPLSPGLATLIETSTFAAPSCVAADVAWPMSGAVGASRAGVVAVAVTSGCPGALSACAGAARPRASVVIATQATPSRFRERATEIVRLLAWRSGHS